MRTSEDKIQTLEFCCKREQRIKEVVREREKERLRKGLLKTVDAVPTCPYFDGSNLVERRKLAMQERGLGVGKGVGASGCQVAKLALARSLLSSSTLTRATTEGRHHGQLQKPAEFASITKKTLIHLSKVYTYPQSELVLFGNTTCNSTSRK